MKRLSLVLGMVLFVAGFALAQRTVTGTIVDGNGEALIGANVLVKGTTSGVATDFDGNYSIEVPDGSNVLVVSYTGFETQELELGASNVLDITMLEGVTLSEAVVTALGISRDEKAIGYAVQEVDGGVLENAREANIVNALNGQVAGVQIQGTPSTLGGSSRITIRGSNSFLGNNRPLWVIDGVPVADNTFSSNSQERGFGGSNAYDYGNTASDIDPATIKTMTVLKGAAATALYGTRGANGVILITTKDGSGMGKKGLGIDVNSSVTFDRVTNLIPHQQQYGGGQSFATASGFNEFIQDGVSYLAPAYAKDGAWGPRYDPNVQVRHWDSWDPNSPNYKETRPWIAPENGYEDFFETGVSFNNSVALSGANDKGSFRLGYSNLSQSGTLPNAELDRNTININSNYQIHERIKVGLVGNYVRTDAENRNITGYNNGNPLQAFTQWWQTQLDVDRLRDNTVYQDGVTQYSWNAIGITKDDATNQFISFNPTPQFFDNPYWVRENFLQEDVRNRFYGNANVAINLMEGLDLTGQVGTDFYQFSTRNGIPIQSVETSYYGEQERRFQETNMELRLSYNKTFGNLSFNGIVGGNRMKQLNRFTDLNTGNGGIALEGFFNIANAAASPIINTIETERGINSVFGSVSFGWNNWLYLDATARNDWSSTLPDSDNSYFYPSVSLSAALNELPALQDISWLSFLKVRASYAEAGNDAGAYSLFDVFSPVTPNFGSFPRYSVPNTQNNPNLRPELTSEVEFGLNARFLNNRFGIDIAYFDRSTTDQIFSVPSSAATGYTSRILNAGEMRNYGFELQLNATPVQTKDFTWNVGVNLFQQNNEVVELTEGVESIARGNTWAASLRISEGDPYMAVYGQDFIRENFERDMDGNIIRNEGRPVIGDDGYYMMTPERVFLGSAIADWTGGFSTSFEYKGIMASALFDFQVGGIIHSTSLQWSKYSGMHPETVEFNGESDIRANGLILPGVRPDGSENNIVITNPQAFYQGTFGFAAPNVYDASFLKLREVRLGYRIPQSIMGSLPFRNANISLFGRNLAILASDLPYLDPQAVTGAGNDQGLENAQVPPIRSFGVNLSFGL